ncbi:MAG: VCBS repeat-containing protein [Planctomycetes bacterium]|nr:VCBS repeat-containing protein [Planctomycetota bacterium]
MSAFATRLREQLAWLAALASPSFLLLFAVHLAAQSAQFATAPVEALLPVPLSPLSATNHSRPIDITRDGAPDFMSYGGFPIGLAPVPSFLTCAVNDGSGRISSYFWAPFPAGSSVLAINGWGVGDLDGDDHLDAAVSYRRDAVTHRIVVYRGDGQGRFTEWPGASFPPGIDANSYVFPAYDFDGDSDCDLMALSPNPSPGAPYVVVLLNDGAGRFSELPQAFPSNHWLGYEFEFGDFDRDGKLDVFTADGWLFLGDGTGHFRLGFTCRVAGGTAMAAGDVDGDGYQDVIFAPATPAMSLWINDRQGGFTEENARLAVTWPGQGTYRATVQLVDLDADGDLDVFACDAPSSIEVFLNDGNGYFTEGRNALGLANRFCHFAIDMDRDGDVDLFENRIGFLQNLPSYWYPNLASNLITIDPALGGTLDVDLYASPGRIVSYLIGFARQDAFLPGIGWAALDPALAVPWPQSAIVPQSRSVRSTLSVPSQTSLRGLRLFAQGLDLDPLAGRMHAMNVWPLQIR